MENLSTKNLIIGDGWSALACVGFLASAGEKVIWIQGSGARVFAPLPVVERGKGVFVWQDLMDRYEVSGAEAFAGSFLREFRSKAFKKPVWLDAPTPESRKEVRDEYLWGPESRIAPAYEVSFEKSFQEMEGELRAKIGELENVKRLEETPVSGFEFSDDENGPFVSVLLGSGEKLTCQRVIFADRWSEIPKLTGLPKPISFLRKRDPVGVIQATFSHDQPFDGSMMENLRSGSIQECFFGVTQKEAGEDLQRHVFGYFMDGGRRSIWSLFLNHSEVEDNHQIAKKFRRIKQSLDKMFSTAGWVESFTSRITDEQVRFDEAAIFSTGEAVTAPESLKKAPGLFFMTDGYGFGHAMEQVLSMLGVECQIRSEGEFSEPGSSDEASRDEGQSSQASEPA